MSLLHKQLTRATYHRPRANSNNSFHDNSLRRTASHDEVVTDAYDVKRMVPDWGRYEAGWVDTSSYAIYTWNKSQDFSTDSKRPSNPLRVPYWSIVVTKKEIVKTISEEIGLTQLKTKEIVQKTFDAIVETLVEEGRIELRNFGVFEVKKRAARKARNPRTGDKVFVPEKFVVTFKPGKEMEERVRQLEEKANLEARAQAEGNLPSTPPAVDESPGLGASPTGSDMPTGFERNPGS